MATFADIAKEQHSSGLNYPLTPRSGLIQIPHDFDIINANAEDVPELVPDEGSPDAKKPRRTKIPLDHRIELTDEELKVKFF